MESQEKAVVRFQKLALLQGHYQHFLPFLDDFMEFLGFSVTEIQADIAQYLVYGPRDRMVQAQRGEAKTTITAAYAIWRLIHDPSIPILILSAGGTQANEIANLVIRFIMVYEPLACMRPDASQGDRTSVEHFDIHFTLKGLNKSPSVACVGITGNLQGKRAGILIADDVESAKNATTATQRETLLQLMRDFPSICNNGEIIYLGTPQSTESNYNTLPGSGFTVRIWPGRYPNAEQLPHYGDMLAPLIRKRLEADPSLMTGGGWDGLQGAPTDPQLRDEAELQRVEQMQGTAYFQLQHMLLTHLADAERKPLHTHKIMVANLPDAQSVFPLEVHRDITSLGVVEHSVFDQKLRFARPSNTSQELAPLQGSCFYIDPAAGGQNGDETGFAFTGFLNTTIYLLKWGGITGGYTAETMEKLADIIFKARPNVVMIEKNFGYGAFREIFLPYLWRLYDAVGASRPGVKDDMVHGQKEIRICNTLEPIIGRGSLVIDESIIKDDVAQCSIHPAAKQKSYSGLLQLAHITRDKDSLSHDD